MIEDVLRVYSMGCFYLAVGEQTLYPHAWRSKKALQIFKFLLIHRYRTVSADLLMDIFWGDDGANVRHSLHNTIYRIRSTIGKAFSELQGNAIIVSQDGNYMIDSDLALWWDAEEFLSLLKSARTLGNGDALDLYQCAFDLYRGPFLPDDTEHDWTVPLRIRLVDRYREAVVQCSSIMLELRKGQVAVSTLKEATKDAPLDEALRCALMNALIVVGQVGQAIYEFMEIKTLLRDELGVDPGSSLVSVYRKALNEGSVRSIEAFAEGEDKTVQGALSCTMESFRSILELELRARARYGTPVTILQVSLADYEVIPERIMISILNSLRAVDVISINANDDVIILLHGVDTSDVGNIVKRVSKAIGDELGLEASEDYCDVSVIRVDGVSKVSGEELSKRLCL